MVRKQRMVRAEATEGRKLRCEFDRGGESREKMAQRGSDGEMESVRKQQTFT